MARRDEHRSKRDAIARSSERQNAPRWLSLGPALALMAGAVIAVVTGIAIVSVPAGGSDDVEGVVAAPPGTAVAADSVAPVVIDAIDSLLAEEFVEIESVGFVDGGRIDSLTSVDTAGRMRLSEQLSTPAEIGDPADDAPIVTEWVLEGTTLSARIIQPGEPRPPDFQRLDVSDQASELLAGAYTHGGRIFDSLDIVRRAMADVPFVAETLGERSLGGATVTGVRARFDAGGMGRWLETSGIERVVSGRSGETVFEFWYADGVLRELVATGVHFHDGEALDDVAVRIDYQPVPSVSISM